MRKSRYVKTAILGISLLAAGCGARMDPLFGPYIRAADQAIENARQKGAQQNCPDKLQALVKQRDDAEKTYMACFYYKAKGMMQQVVNEANALDCAPPKPAAAPAPPPPAPKPAPKPAPPVAKDTDGDGVLDPQDQCPGTPKGARVDARGCWVLSGLRFDTNQSAIKPQYRSILDEAAQVMVENPGMRIEIQGHTDSRGSDRYNQGLSERRAKSVRAYLISLGVPASRMTAVGFGESKPAATNDTADGRSQNRRVELKPIY